MTAAKGMSHRRVVQCRLRIVLEAVMTGRKEANREGLAPFKAADIPFKRTMYTMCITTTTITTHISTM